jgi:hypothetical protein
VLKWVVLDLDMIIIDIFFSGLVMIVLSP